METISNITSTASKAIWGESNTTAQSGTEPRSGEQGVGNTNDPYDHGNEDREPADSSEATTTTTTTHANTNKTPVAGESTSENRSGPSEATSSDVAGDPKSGQNVTQKQQGADRPTEEPSSKKNEIKMPHTDEEREELMMKGEFPHDPADHSGEPLKMHDGSETKKERSQSVAQEGGNPHGKIMGTGEQYVKSSGMVAEGGDFDAANPGAGHEATRLMEEKGIKSEGTRIQPEDTTANSSKGVTGTVDNEKVKVSKMEKIKEKLHIKH